MREAGLMRNACAGLSFETLREFKNPLNNLHNCKAVKGKLLQPRFLAIYLVSFASTAYATVFLDANTNAHVGLMLNGRNV